MFMKFGHQTDGNFGCINFDQVKWYEINISFWHSSMVKGQLCTCECNELNINSIDTGFD